MSTRRCSLMASTWNTSTCPVQAGRILLRLAVRWRKAAQAANTAAARCRPTPPGAVRQRGCHKATLLQLACLRRHMVLLCMACLAILSVAQGLEHGARPPHMPRCAAARLAPLTSMTGTAASQSRILLHVTLHQNSRGQVHRPAWPGSSGSPSNLGATMICINSTLASLPGCLNMMAQVHMAHSAFATVMRRLAFHTIAAMLSTQ